MLGNIQPTATVPVRDLTKARRFYEDTIGLSHIEYEAPESVVYDAGGSKLLVYESEYAGTNRATAVTWTLGERLDDVVSDLRSRGVRFEHYDLPDTVREGDVHIAGETRAAWFKDPDANIHALVNG